MLAILLEQAGGVSGWYITSVLFVLKLWQDRRYVAQGESYLAQLVKPPAARFSKVWVDKCLKMLGFRTRTWVVGMGSRSQCCIVISILIIISSPFSRA